MVPRQSVFGKRSIVTFPYLLGIRQNQILSLGRDCKAPNPIILFTSPQAVPDPELCRHQFTRVQIPGSYLPEPVLYRCKYQVAAAPSYGPQTGQPAAGLDSAMFSPVRTSKTWIRPLYVPTTT